MRSCNGSTSTASSGRVDVDGIIRRIDVDAIIRRIDVNGIVQRVDVPAIVSQVRVSQVIGESASHIGEESLAMARRTVGRLDAALLQPVDRAAGRTSEEDRAARAGLAGPLSRLGAWFLDTVVISATFSAIVFVASYLVSLFSTREVDPTHASGPWWVVAATGWAGLYLFVGWFLTQRTVGMAIVGLRIAGGDGSTMRARGA